jgi:hypothetical protein
VDGFFDEFDHPDSHFSGAIAYAWRYEQIGNSACTGFAWAIHGFLWHKLQRQSYPATVDNPHFIPVFESTWHKSM